MPREQPLQLRAPEAAARAQPAAPQRVSLERYQRARALAERAPPHARVGVVRCGTAGWTDPTLVRSSAFYPRSARTPEARLRHYAAQFRLVELDASYYALPSVVAAQRWCERTEPGFLFDVKAFAALTGHPVELARLPADLRSLLPRALRDEPRVRGDALPDALRAACFARFAEGLTPLVLAHRLGAVLLQFPPWFEATRGAARALEALRYQLPGVDLAVELRHRSWYEPARRERVLSLLRAHRLAHVCVDGPQGHDNSVPRVPAVTNPALAVLRLHGRRGEPWSRPGATVLERFDYLYDPRELAALADDARALAAQADDVHVVFNNCVRDYAVVGARGMAALLAGEGLDEAATEGEGDGPSSATPRENPA